MDLEPIAARGYVTIIGLVGPHDAGKTTFLLALYLLLLRSGRLGAFRFAGSATLGAWERLASFARYTATHEATFPPHTPSGPERVPGLFHLALRDDSGRLRDVVLTDAPGEWFTRWATQAEDPRAAGARWVVSRANAFLVFADCAALSGIQRGSARGKLIDLMRRLGSEAGRRPITFLWSKADVPVREEMRRQIELARTELLSCSTVRFVSILDESKLADILPTVDELLTLAGARAASENLSEPVFTHDPFLAFRMLT